MGIEVQVEEVVKELHALPSLARRRVFNFFGEAERDFLFFSGGRERLLLRASAVTSVLRSDYLGLRLVRVTVHVSHSNSGGNGKISAQGGCA